MMKADCSIIWNSGFRGLVRDAGSGSSSRFERIDSVFFPVFKFSPNDIGNPNKKNRAINVTLAHLGG